MKKVTNYYLCLSAIIVMFITGCEASKIEEASLPSQEEGQAISLYATSAEDNSTNTKARYDDYNNYSVWDSGDEIGVAVGSNNNILFTQGVLSEDHRSSTYTGTLTGLDETSVSLWAKFPYTKTDTFTPLSLITTITDQNYVSSGYHFPIALAHYKGVVSGTGIENVNLKFSNPFTTLQISLYTQIAGAEIYSIVFQGNNSEKIGGPVTFTLTEEGVITPDLTSATSETITLRIPNSTLSTNSALPSVYYITVPNIDYANGFSITVNTTKGKAIKSKTAEADFRNKNNTIISMPSFEVIPQTIIPDAAFRTYLKGKGYIESADNEEVTITAAGLAATEIDVSYNTSITDLTGIEYFPALTTLKCNNCSLSSLDLSGCSALEQLDCSMNSTLTTLTLPTTSTTLTSLLCYECSLNTLDVSGCSALATLNCVENITLTTLTLPVSSTTLTYLYCYDCSLTSLDISGCSALFNFDCADNNNLSSLIIPTTSSTLTYFYCYNCSFASLDVSGYSALEFISCYGNSTLSSLTLPASSKVLERIFCNGCSLVSLDVSGCSALSNLNCYSNRLSSLDASKMANPTNYILYCGKQTSDGSTAQNMALILDENQKSRWNSSLKSDESNSGVYFKINIPDEAFRTYLQTKGYIEYIGNNVFIITATGLAATTIDLSSNTSITDLTGIEYFPALSTLNCSGCSLTTLDVSGCSALKVLSCYSSSTLSTLTLPTALTELRCSDCSLTTLDVSGCSALSYFDCNRNKSLTTLTLPSSSTSLTNLFCLTCAFPSLDVSGCSALKSIQCSNNKALTTLTLPTTSTTLTSLNCYNCALTSLDVSGCSALATLDCSGIAALTTLTLPTASTKLTELFCYSCSLTSLNVSGCLALSNLTCNDNRLSLLNASTMANPTSFILYCGLQTSDGSTAQTLTLTLATSQKNRWNNTYKDNSLNSGVTLAD